MIFSYVKVAEWPPFGRELLIRFIACFRLPFIRCGLPEVIGDVSKSKKVIYQELDGIHLTCNPRILVSSDLVSGDVDLIP